MFDGGTVAGLFTEIVQSCLTVVNAVRQVRLRQKVFSYMRCVYAHRF
jgi:hypothetical protein